jgi:hypothetical protein
VIDAANPVGCRPPSAAGSSGDVGWRDIDVQPDSYVYRQPRFADAAASASNARDLRHEPWY